MGRWAQYRHRGRGVPRSGLEPFPAEDWSLAFDDEECTPGVTYRGVVESLAPALPGVVYWQVRYSGDESTWTEVSPQLFSDPLASDCVPVETSPLFIQVRGLDGDMNPVTDWSASKSVVS